MLTLKDGQLWQATNTHLLVIYGDESLAEEDAFAQLCSFYLPHITQTDKIYWFRRKAPSALPKGIQPHPWQLARITFRYFREKLVDGVAAFCASAHTVVGRPSAFVVEFHDEDVPHVESLSTILALLCDLGNYFSKTFSSGTSSEPSIYPVTALFRTSRIFDYALVTTLYTNCILRFEDGVCQNMLT
ncbi:unnamed protein product [Gongylonema pulchrum]|uniref:Glycylpeptide N-tetradecanoyltransferase n=1 Tax=Gongylonema pulchrum TaxID=637853 RepID=A0A183DQZ4_9BILA|nr:unnamed protein product [Gongylonema pulchrum]